MSPKNPTPNRSPTRGEWAEEIPNPEGCSCVLVVKKYGPAIVVCKQCLDQFPDYPGGSFGVSYEELAE